MLTTWWAWIAAAVIFAILETLAPVFVFLGLGAGAGAIGLLLAFGVTFGGSIAWLLVAFAAISLGFTIALRMVLGGKTNETKTFTDDINQR